MSHTHIVDLIASYTKTITVEVTADTQSDAITQALRNDAETHLYTQKWDTADLTLSELDAEPNPHSPTV